MRRLCLAMWCLAACAPQVRVVDVAPSLPGCLDGRAVNEVRVTGLGDFPPQAGGAAAATPSGSATLNLPSDTRVVQVDGTGPAGLAAFGRTPPLDLARLYGTRIAVAYGPLDGLCVTGKLNYARAGHRATSLLAGGVLISGGVDADGFAVPRLELYQPLDDEAGAAATFRIVDQGGPTTLDARAALGHATALLPDGGVLLTGGAPAKDGRAHGIAFEGATHLGPDGKRVGAPAILGGGPRAFHTATALPDGRILIAGGCAQLQNGACAANALLDTSVIYDSVTDTFSDGPRLRSVRWDHAAASLGGGTVLLSGGRDDLGQEPSLERVRIEGQSDTGTSDAGTGGGRAALLPTGSVALVGSSAGPSARVSLWVGAATPLPLQVLGAPREGQEVIALEDGGFLIAGGAGQPLVVYDAHLQPTAHQPYSRVRFAAARIGDGSVLLSGGAPDGSASTDAFVYLRSPLGPYSSLPTLTFDSPADPFVPRQPNLAVVAGGRLRVTASDGRLEVALAAGMVVGEVTVEVGVGLDAPDGAAALIVGWRSAYERSALTLAPGLPVRLDGDPGCSGAAPDAGELPVGALAPVRLSWREGRLTVGTPARTWLDCRPAQAIARGAVGLGAVSGTALFDNWTITR